jgi:single-strand DNA-binding protein
MINRTLLVGRITRDPEVKKTQSGVSVVSFTLAVNRTYKKEGEQEADFINCVAWRNQADFLGNYITKGALLGVDGRIQTRNYEDQTGKTVYITEVVCETVQALESKQQRDKQDTYTPAPKVEEPLIEIDTDELPF